MKLAANLSLMYTEWPFAERPQKAAEDGFKFVECMFPYELPALELKALADEAGVAFVLINAPAGDWAAGDRGLAADPAKIGEFRRSIDTALEYADVLEVKQMHVLGGTAAPDRHPLFWDHYVSCLDWLCRHDSRMHWLIEPLNTRDVPGYLLNYQEQAHELARQLGHGNLKVQMDLYHCQIMEGDLIMRLRQYLPSGKVGHIQIAGVPERHEPDSGEIQIERIFDELRSLNWSGWVGCEYRPRNSTRDGLDWLSKAGF